MSTIFMNFYNIRIKTLTLNALMTMKMKLCL